MARGTQVLISLFVGLTIAWGASTALRYSIEAPEIRNYTPGQPLFTHPVTEGYARVVGEQLRAKLDREATIRRFENSASLPVVVSTRLLGFLFDPINLALTGLFTWAAFFAIRRITPRHG